jgi:hypothetical protein
LNGWAALVAIAPVRQGWPENMPALPFGNRHCASFMRKPDAVAMGVQTVPPAHPQPSPK